MAAAAAAAGAKGTPPGKRDDASCCVFCSASMRGRAGYNAPVILLLLATAGLVLTTLRISASRVSPARVLQQASPGEAEAETSSTPDCSCYTPCTPSENFGSGGGSGAPGAVASSLPLQNILSSTGATFSWSQPTQQLLQPLWLANDSLHKQHFAFQCVAASGACGRQGATSTPAIVVVVFSAPANVARRRAIRRTWASEAAAAAARVVFLLADTADESLRRSVRAESAAYGDLLVTTGAPDAYDLLTVKSVAMLQWARDSCPLARYLVKTDDDVYLSLLHLAAALPSPSRRIMMGSRRSGLKVVVDPAHKWYNPLYLRHYGDTYPTYLSGTAYVVAMPLVAELHAAAQRLPFDLMEDVFVTGVCADRTVTSRALRVHHRGFSIYRREPCEFARKDAITAHDMSPEDMLAVWAMLRSGRCGQ